MLYLSKTCKVMEVVLFCAVLIAISVLISMRQPLSQARLSAVLTRRVSPNSFLTTTTLPVYVSFEGQNTALYIFGRPTFKI